MGDFDVVGGLELRVLLATLRLDGNAYTTTLVEELEARAGRTVSPAAVYIALRRLEKRGLVTSEVRKEQALGGCRPRRYFEATHEGIELAEQTRRELDGLWAGLAFGR